MKARIIIAAAALLAATVAARGQQQIPLYDGPAPGTEHWTWDEIELNGSHFNVSHPSLTVFLPEKGKATGHGVIICPGGSFHGLATTQEGYTTARRLADKGIAAFVLRYRTAYLGDDLGAGLTRVVNMMGDNIWMLDEASDSIVQFGIRDGLNAIRLVRERAGEFGIDTDRLGIMGFSAGGAVAVGSVSRYHDAQERPDFIAPVYAYTPPLGRIAVRPDAPKAFISAAADDDLDMARAAADLFSRWIAGGKLAELHIYSLGGHGYGGTERGMPVDSWVDRFAEWLFFEFPAQAETADTPAR